MTELGLYQKKKERRGERGTKVPAEWGLIEKQGNMYV